MGIQCCVCVTATQKEDAPKPLPPITPVRAPVAQDLDGSVQQKDCGSIGEVNNETASETPVDMTNSPTSLQQQSNNNDQLSNGLKQTLTQEECKERDYSNQCLNQKERITKGQINQNGENENIRGNKSQDANMTDDGAPFFQNNRPNQTVDNFDDDNSDQECTPMLQSQIDQQACSQSFEREILRNQLRERKRQIDIDKRRQQILGNQRDNSKPKSMNVGQEHKAEMNMPDINQRDTHDDMPGAPQGIIPQQNRSAFTVQQQRDARQLTREAKINFDLNSSINMKKEFDKSDDMENAEIMNEISDKKVDELCQQNSLKPDFQLEAQDQSNKKDCDIKNDDATDGNMVNEFQVNQQHSARNPPVLNLTTFTSSNPALEHALKQNQNYRRKRTLKQQGNKEPLTDEQITEQLLQMQNAQQSPERIRPQYLRNEDEQQLVRGTLPCL